MTSRNMARGPQTDSERAKYVMKVNILACEGTRKILHTKNVANLFFNRQTNCQRQLVPIEK